MQANKDTLQSEGMSIEDGLSRYTLGDFAKLNRGNIKLPRTLDQLFSKYKMPSCCVRDAYMNPFNEAFAKASGDTVSTPSRNRIRKQANLADADDRIIQDLRGAFSSVITGKDGAVLCTAKINQMNISPKLVNEVADFFYATMIQNTSLIPQYIEVLFSLHRRDLFEKELQLRFCQKAVKTFDNPATLEKSNIMDAETRTRQHRETAVKILAYLYAYKYEDAPSCLDLSGPRTRFSKQTHLYKAVEQQLAMIQEYTDNSQLTRAQDEIKCLALFIKIIKDSGRFPKIVSDFQGQLQSLFNNKTYKLMHRMALYEFLPKKSK